MIVSRRQEWERRNPRTMIQEVQIGDLKIDLLFMFRKVHTLLKDVMSPIDSLYNHDSHI